MDVDEEEGTLRGLQPATLALPPNEAGEAGESERSALETAETTDAPDAAPSSQSASLDVDSLWDFLDDDGEDEEPLPDARLDPEAYAAAKQARAQRAELRRQKQKAKLSDKRARRKAKEETAAKKQKQKQKQRPAKSATKNAKAKPKAPKVESDATSVDEDAPPVVADSLPPPSQRFSDRPIAAARRLLGEGAVSDERKQWITIGIVLVVLIAGALAVAAVVR